MNKLLIIAKREFVVRATSKKFILATLLTPIVIAAIFGVSILISLWNKGEQLNILVNDTEKQVLGFIDNTENLTFEIENLPHEEAVTKYDDPKYDILVSFVSDNESSNTEKATYLSKRRLGISKISEIEMVLSKAIRLSRIEHSSVDKELLESFKVNVSMENADYLDSNKTGESKLSSIIGTGLGFVMGMLMYLIIFVYGSMVMRSVMEEKVNRIVEVIVSSVKPFQLMLGKVLGVAAVGLAQVVLWSILIPVLLFIISAVAGITNNKALENIGSMNNAGEQSLDNIDIVEIITSFTHLNWTLILPVFLLCFLGGFFIYSSLFAAIGAAIGDDLGESNSLMLPVTAPVIISMFIMTKAIEDPNSPLVVFGSLFPLFSPVVMPARLAFDPPLWQVFLSIALMFGTAVLMIFLSGKIYRIGILLYGKKASLKELGKWLFSKEN